LFVFRLFVSALDESEAIERYAEINCKVPEGEQNFGVWRRIQGMGNVTMCQNGNTALCLVNTVKPVTQNVSQKFVCMKNFHNRITKWRQNSIWPLEPPKFIFLKTTFFVFFPICNKIRHT
jgi:hypothetical protein